jgi:virginiamycin B lyase
VNGSPPAVGSRGGIRLRTAALLLTALMTLSLALAARADALIYFPNNDRILRAALNGAGAHPFISGADHPCGIAVNGTHIFWVNRGNPNAISTGHIGRARLDGTEVNQKFIPNVGTEACGIAVNSSHIYWGAGTTVGRANLDGSGKNNALIGEQGSHVCGVDATSQFLYWANETSGQIARGALDGSFAQPNYVAGVGIVCGVAVNSTHMHWASVGFAAIGRAPTTPLSQQNTFIDTEFGSPCDVALNSTHLFWTDRTGVGRANLDGSGVNLEFVKDPLAVPGTPSTYTDCGVEVDSRTVPANTFKLGKVKLNKKKGTALLTVPTVWPGRVIAAGKGVKRTSRRAGGVGKVKLLIRAKRKKLRRLNRAGRVRLRVRVTHRPAGGTATSKRKRIRLVKKR